MDRVIIGVLAFAAGAAVGGWYVKRYIQQHPGETIGGAIAEKVFGEGSTAAKYVKGIGVAVDEVFVQ